jgi:hypothetical protein
MSGGGGRGIWSQIRRRKNCVGFFEISSTIRPFPKVILLDAVHVTAKKNRLNNSIRNSWKENIAIIYF